MGFKKQKINCKIKKKNSLVLGVTTLDELAIKCENYSWLFIIICHSVFILLKDPDVKNRFIFKVPDHFSLILRACATHDSKDCFMNLSQM